MDDMRRFLRTTTGGMDPDLHHDFAVGEPVMTADGLPGVVTGVLDGPVGGAEVYEVVLDNDMGGGDYDASHLSALQSRRTASAAESTVEDDEDDAEGSTGRLASNWYPELAEILQERPPLPHSTVLASRQATKWVVTDDGGNVLHGPVADSREAKDFAAEIESTEGTAHVQPYSDGQDFTGWANGSDAEVASRPLAARETPVQISPQGSFLDRVLDPAFRSLDEKFPGQAWNPEGNKSVADWCRFRRDERCYYPKDFDYDASVREGYAIWIPHDRGICERGSHQAQADCPISEPGPNSGAKVRFVDATIPYEQGGQRGGTPTLSSQAKRILADAERQPTFGWHLTSAWSDIQAKAKQIRQQGGVRIISVLDYIITAQVRGDTDTYVTTLIREPGTSRRAMWECECSWAKYVWGRSPAYKHLEGRPCAHLLALSYEVASQEAHGGEVVENPEQVSWQLAASKASGLPPKVAAILTRMPKVAIHQKIAMPPIKADPTIEEVVDYFSNLARVEEPATSTAMRTSVERFGGILEDFQYRIKGADSIRRKVTDRWDRPGDRRDLIQDYLRYTMVFHPAVYSVGVQKSLWALEEMGFRVIEEENYWSGGPYQGLNYVLQNRNGVPVELQFHTDEGHALKAGALHALYEEFREDSTPLARKQELYDIMSSYWREVEIPAEVHNFPGLDKHHRPVAVRGTAAPVVAILRDAKARTASSQGLWARVRGRLVEIVSLLPGGKARTTDGGEVDAREIQFHKYDPVRGLAFHGSLDGDDFDIFSEGELKDDPEPALPSTTADDGDDLFGSDLTDDDNARAEAMVRQATGQATEAMVGPEWLSPSGSSKESSAASSDIAQAARQFLASGEVPDAPGIQATAVKVFTPAEQQEIITEGENVRAANLGDLQLEGTHYDPITDEDDDLLW